MFKVIGAKLMILTRLKRLTAYLQTNTKALLPFLKAHLTVRRAIFFGIAFVVSLLVLFISLWGLVWIGAMGSLPHQKELLLVKNPVASEIYSSDSVLMGRYFIQERSNIRYEELPHHVIDALVSTEDVRFYNHGGIDIRSLLRVFVKSLLLQNESAGGGSTITQQLAKNLYPRKSYWIFSQVINKIREMIIASRLEATYDKETILTLYLNTIPFGDNTYGLEAAAQRFFSVPVSDLSVDQAAVLIGMLKANHFYNPRIFPQHALQRRNVVLAQMRKYHKLETGQVDSLQALPIALNYNNMTHHSGLAPYFREYIRPELVQWCEQYNRENDEPINLYTAGLKIYTTIDSRLQAYAEEAVTGQMATLQKRFLDHWGKTNPWNHDPGVVEDAIRKSDHYRNLADQGMPHDEIMKVMRTPVLMSILTVDGEKDVTMSPVDSLQHYLKFLNAGMLAIDPASGAIRIWLGGINHQFFQYDHVKASTRRQVGSTFKPIVYATALEQGIRPCDFISAEKTVYTNMEDWVPENSEENYGLKYSMPGALAYSVNTVSVRVLEKGGIDNTIALARKMGITSTLEPVPSMALGAADISMMEMVSAYACFANQGKTVKPYYITSITTHQDQVLEKFKPSTPATALSPESAQLMLHMLRRAVNEGTSSSLRSQFGLTNDIAGKTGTTQSNADGWFIAVTPRLVIGSWVGADDPRIRFRSTALGQGSRTALPLVGEFFRLANKDATLNSITRARFPDPSASVERKLSCDLYKTDKHPLRDLFVRHPKERKREFGEPKKKGFFKRLFGRK
jgi:penicillin-binding protein 1A